MASNKSRVQSDISQFFRVDEAVQNDLARSVLDFREKKKRQIQERNAILQQMSRYQSEVQGLAKPARGASKALDGLLGIHETLAKHKLAPPQVIPGPGGVSGLSYSVTVTPPYQYQPPTQQAIYPDGYEPTLMGVADPSTGQLSATAVTANQGTGTGWIDNALGVYFTSSVPGTLTASVNPIYSFEWWTESFSASAAVTASLQGALNIWGGLPGGSIEAAFTEPFVYFNEQQPGPLVLKDGFNLQGSASLSVPLDPSLVYIIFVSVDASALGLGAGGSIAGAMVSVTVPSITYDFQMQPVVNP